MDRVGYGMIGSFVVGTALGASLGLLFAPQKGSETREWINKRIVDLEKELKEMGDHLFQRHHGHNGSNKTQDELKARIKELEKQLKELHKQAQKVG